MLIFTLVQFSEIHGAERIKSLTLDKSEFGSVKDFSNSYGV